MDELCQASVAPYEPIIAVRRVLRLWVGVAQQAAITGSAAAFARANVRKDVLLANLPLERRNTEAGTAVEAGYAYALG